MLWLLLILQPDLGHERARDRFVLVEHSQQVLPDRARLLACIDLRPDAGLLVVTDDRTRLLVVRSQSFLQRVGVIIAPLDEWLARHIISHLLLRRVEDLVVGATRGGVDEAASDARNEQIVVDLELDCVLQRLRLAGQHLVELLRLRDRPGEAIEDEAMISSLADVLDLGRTSH